LGKSAGSCGAGAIFVFVTGDRGPGEDALVVVGAEQTGTGTPVTMFRHTLSEVSSWLERHGFRLVDTLEFTVWRDKKRSERFPARAYLAQRDEKGNEPIKYTKKHKNWDILHKALYLTEMRTVYIDQKR